MEVEINTTSKSDSEMKEELEKETAAYKEHIKQHAMTICAMEERLDKLLKKNKDLSNENTVLRQTVNENKTKLPVIPKPKVIVQKSPQVDLVAMEKLIIQLRRENADFQKKNKEQQDVISGLRRDLTGAAARLSDVKGELSQSQKQEVEKKQQRIIEQETELIELRQKMVKLSQIVDRQAKEVKDLSATDNKTKGALSKYKNMIADKDNEIKNLREQLDQEQKEAKKNLDLMSEEGRITSELTALGAQCRGDRHEQIIARQREALAELRGRIRTLEQTHPPIPNHDQALQQVVLLKKELAELRAHHAIHGDKGISNGILDRQSSSAGTTHSHAVEIQGTAKAEIERSAHRETMESLEMSEKSFLILLRAISGSLEMDDVAGLRSIAHIPKDERAKLFSEREQSAEILSSRIKVLKERIARKDELLQGYERDLAKLRQAEQLAIHKGSQVEALTEEIRQKTEEVQYLRESLNRTKEKLDQEKRNASAMKLKKAFSEDKVERGWGRHVCPPEDVTGKVMARKKEKSEMLKKKNYEIRSLKTELSSRERELDATQKQLYMFKTGTSVQGSA